MLFYKNYKIFRRYIRSFSIYDNLEYLKNILLFLHEDIPLSPDLRSLEDNGIASLKKNIHPWEIETLIRELILNGSTYGTKSFSTSDNFLKAINMLREIEDLSANVGLRNNRFSDLELDRIIHRQIIWQNEPDGLSITKANMVFGEEHLSKLVEDEYGMEIKKIILLMLFAKTILSKSAHFDTSTNFELLSIKKEDSIRIFDRIKIPMKDLKEEFSLSQAYDENWAYTWNPLISHPLVIPDINKPNQVICPIPTLLLRRSTSGIFYDLVNNKRFTNPFGASFERFVGKIINRSCDKERFIVTKIEPYIVNKSQKHGVDWIISDISANLFIETKTKRLSLKSKTTTDPEHMDKDIDILANAIIQNYNNIKDIYNGETKFKVNDMPSYSMIITMEDWYFVNPCLSQKLSTVLIRKMKEKDIDIEYLDKYPFSILSSNEFEYACQAIGIIGIKNSMDRILRNGKFNHSIIPRASRMFGDLNINNFLFSDYYDSIWAEEIKTLQQRLHDRQN